MNNLVNIPQDKWFEASKVDGMNNLREIDGKVYKFVYADPREDFIKAKVVCSYA